MLKVYEPSGSVLFEEKQKFPQWLSILILGIMITLVIGIVVMAFTLPKQKNEAWLGLAIALPIQAGVLILFQKAKLEKIVTTNGLYYRWTPWNKKYSYVEKENIKEAEVRKGPPMNYGFGWFPGYGKFYNASTGDGLQLYLMSGDKIYFSTFDSAFFQRAVQSLISTIQK